MDVPEPRPAGVDPSTALLEVLVSGPTTWTTLAGLALPLLTGLVTGRSWHPAAKGLMLAALAFAAAVVAELVEAGASGPVDWRAILTRAFLAWVVGQVAHAGVWRHTSVSQRLQDVTLRPGPREPEPAPPGWGSPGDVDVAERSVAAIRARVSAESPAVRPIKAPAGTPRQHTPAPPLLTAAVDPARMRRARPPRYLRDDDGPTTLPER